MPVGGLSACERMCGLSVREGTVHVDTRTHSITHQAQVYAMFPTTSLGCTTTLQTPCWGHAQGDVYVEGS